MILGNYNIYTGQTTINGGLLEFSLPIYTGGGTYNGLSGVPPGTDNINDQFRRRPGRHRTLQHGRRLA